MAQIDDTVRLVALNGGQIVGKTRLQKSAYFLEVKHVGLGVLFTYHHYGPYSEELSELADDAVALHHLGIDWKVSQTGANYAIYSAPTDVHLLAEEEDDTRKKVLDVLRRYSAIELELAATADYLSKNGYSADPWLETRRRKSSKASPQRVENSKALLDELSLF